MKVQVLGAGGWGTALAVHLVRLGHSVFLWARRAEAADEMRRTGANETYLPGIALPKSLQVVDAPVDAQIHVVAVPTQYIRATLGGLTGLAADRPFVTVSKGIEIETLKLPTEIVAEAVGARRCGVLSGPSHALEVAQGLPASLVAAAEDPALAESIQRLFMGPTMRVYTAKDRLGVEIAGALKNVIALAAGISDGLRLGDNAKAGLIVRGSVEIGRFGVRLGGDRETFRGLAGIGDLIVTCTSRHGRNLRVGREIGAGRTLGELLGGMRQVAEGVYTCKAVVPWASRLGVEIPICAEVYRVLYESKPPAEGVRDLMTRTPKAEF